MKLKLLAIAFAASFALTACDSSSTSSDANEPVSENSNPGQDQQTTEVKKDSTSSESSVDKGKTSTDTKDNEETAKTSNGSNINLEGIGMTQEQYNLLRAFETKMGDVDDTGKKFSDILNDGECQNGDIQSAVYLGQNVQWTCIYEEWVPTSGFDKVIEAILPEELDEILAESGMTKEDVLAMLNFLSNLDMSKNDADVVVESVERCEGSRMVQVEKLVKKNVTDESRTLVYKEMVGKCKDYRDGKITYEELMMD
ncbi:hypothetical protein [uncultured Fibrobacter sp.]|uniref:hypothetical protein n=1 Tax=uncultured Fibrobacter sp. TaxID=261512 RepID=UPI0025EE2B3A|nr:hypothetical protein [uncultured Fibrobacter sp.]